MCAHVCVCVYALSISIACTSQEELTLIKSNEQLYDFYKWVFKKKRHCGKYIFDISELILSNKHSYCDHINGGFNIYLYGCLRDIKSEY